MDKFYDIEDIVGHRKCSDGTMEYFVKWKNYGTESNTWEPRENFLSPQLLEDYQRKCDSRPVVLQHEKYSPKVKRSRDYLLLSDLLPEDIIAANGYEPEKILNIFHMRDNEKELVAVVQFKNRKDFAFVHAAWANDNCPELVIEFYESRIYWRQQYTGKLIKSHYANSA